MLFPSTVYIACLNKLLLTACLILYLSIATGEQLTTSLQSLSPENNCKLACATDNYSEPVLIVLKGISRPFQKQYAQKDYKFKNKNYGVSGKQYLRKVAKNLQIKKVYIEKVNCNIGNLKVLTISILVDCFNKVRDSHSSKICICSICICCKYNLRRK